MRRLDWGKAGGLGIWRKDWNEVNDVGRVKIGVSIAVVVSNHEEWAMGGDCGMGNRGKCYFG